MAKGREIRAFHYVNHPYEQVRDALGSEALAIFQSATQAAASRAHSVAAGLHVNVKGIEVGAPIAIQITEIEEDTGNTQAERALRVGLEWEAATAPRLFPVMRGRLSAYPLSATETQLDFEGRYEPPLGPLGGALDSLVGHRVAEASVHRFVMDVAGHLRKALAD
jgi:hypothetical protein